MKRIKGLINQEVGAMSHNVYCGYSSADHNILCARTAHDDRKNRPEISIHQRTWSDLQRRKDAGQEEPFLDTVIGGVAFAMLIVALAFL